MKERFLTGIKPTGYMHIGNYFGAIKPAIELSNKEDAEAFYFIADHHALTTIKDKNVLKEYVKKMACSWLACGLDPEKVVFYRQSDLLETFELSCILSNYTPKGLMNRAHAYKAISDKNKKEGVDVDSGVNMGLFNYPILMAADILIASATRIPVGLDQKQHIEIARDIASYFNKTVQKEVFVLPNEHIEENSKMVIGLDGRKMSKSYGNTIQLFSDEKTLKKEINRIVTDSLLPGEPKDKNCSLAKIHKLFANKEEQKVFENSLEGGLGWGDAKKILFEKANSFIKPMLEKYNYYMENYHLVEEMFAKGKEKISLIAKSKMEKVRKSVGII